MGYFVLYVKEDFCQIDELLCLNVLVLAVSYSLIKQEIGLSLAQLSIGNFYLSKPSSLKLFSLTNR